MPPAPGLVNRYTQRPKTPLNEAALLTNAPDEPSLAPELKAEIESADRIDLLCAFVMWRGLRLLQTPLQRAREAGIPIRVITTTYIGGTEREHWMLVATSAPRSKSSTTRPHAAARQGVAVPPRHRLRYCLRRLVQPVDRALLDGVEWNVRLPRRLRRRCSPSSEATFDTYWNDSEFETYDPDQDRDRLDDALADASGQRQQRSGHDLPVGLEVRPFPYQQEMLEPSRSSGRSTIGTAICRRRHRDRQDGRRGARLPAAVRAKRRPPSLLFVAHRREILEQSLRTYRRCWPTATSASCMSAGAAGALESTCSPAFSR